MEKQTLATIAATTARGDEPQITISTVALDRDRDEVVPEGGDFTAYQRNPVVLFGHDRSGLPVGSTTTLEVVPGRGIRARWRWLEGDAFAARVKNAFEQGVLRAASIGFLPQASEPNGNGGRRFTKWELLEWSLVPLPANADAVRALKALDLWTSDDIVLELAEDGALELDLERSSSSAVAGSPILRALVLQKRGFRHTEPFEPVFDVDTQELKRLIASDVSKGLAGRIGEEVAANLRRHLGKVD